MLKAVALLNATHNPVHWKVLECIFLTDGFIFLRQESSHRVYVKPGVARPVIIPVYKSIKLNIIMGNMRSAKMSRPRYLHLLNICKDK